MKQRTPYTQEFREAILQRMLSGESNAQIAAAAGISPRTLSTWRCRARLEGRLPPAPPPASGPGPADKFLMVRESYGMNEEELGAYARSKGVFVEDLRRWQDNCLQVNGGMSQDVVRVNAEKRELDRQCRELRKELHRAQLASAELAALLTLSKKARAIWGEREDA